jgi:Carboxypeptidase regulatory-like domain/TonB-dependent Receptor Plug Domain
VDLATPLNLQTVADGIEHADLVGRDSVDALSFDVFFGRLAIALAVVCALNTLSAQSPTFVRGHVRVTGDTSPVPLAAVELEGVSQLQLTDSAGAFRLTGIAPGKYRLRVRRLGYYPATQFVDVVRGDSTDVLVAIKVLPQILHEVVISGRIVSVPWRFEDVYRRGSSGFGHFITREEIELRNPSITPDLLGGIPGIVTYNDLVVFQKCRKRLRGGPGLEAANKVQVYIDGRRFTRFDDSDEGVMAALGSVNPRDIQAIEVYTGIAQIPGEFATQACGVVAIWTKKY